MTNKIKIEIKSVWGTVLFEHETLDNTLLKTVNEAVRSGANLSSANLGGAYLRGANLGSADLRGANLGSADLGSADLGSADLGGANLGSADLGSADLGGAYLRGADLRGANLGSADLRGANLGSADLGSADLGSADLGGADLGSADLGGAYLRGANLGSAYLGGADLGGAYLRGADLGGANLGSANLGSAKNADLAIAMTRILPEGQLIGWKKCRDGVIVKLQIPAKAKRSHAFGRKCRAEYAKVLQIFGADEATSTHAASFIYRKGDIVRPVQGWDEDWTKECAAGIHFFITREEAENYA